MQVHNWPMRLKGQVNAVNTQAEASITFKATFMSKVEHVWNRVHASLFAPIFVLWVLIEVLYRVSDPGLKRILDVLTFQR
jgi:hypothetical protein